MKTENRVQLEKWRKNNMTNEEAKEWLSPETSPMRIHISELNGENPMDYINQAIKVAITALDKQISQKLTVYSGCNFTYHCISCNKLLYWTDEPRNHGEKLIIALIVVKN